MYSSNIQNDFNELNNIFDNNKDYNIIDNELWNINPYYIWSKIGFIPRCNLDNKKK